MEVKKCRLGTLRRIVGFSSYLLTREEEQREREGGRRVKNQCQGNQQRNSKRQLDEEMHVSDFASSKEVKKQSGHVRVGGGGCWRSRIYF